MISQNAEIHSSAKIATGVSIGPWTTIGKDVSIDSGSSVGSHVVIEKNTRIGKDTHISSHVAIGSDPQHLGYAGEETWLEIGDHNIIREFATINRGTKEVGVTRIGDHNYLMSYTHVAHDCVLGNHIIFANNASIAGHVSVGDHAILGAFSGVHQFVHIGEHCFLGRATKIIQDILPFMLAIGNPGVPRGVNSVGLRRHGYAEAELLALKSAYSILFRKGLVKAQIIAELTKLADSKLVACLLQAYQQSERGVARPSATEVELEVV